MKVKIVLTEKSLLGLLFLILTLLSIPFFTQALPRTDGIAFFFRTWFIYTNLKNFNPFEFNDLWYQGTFLYTFYPPLSFYFPAFLKFVLPFPLEKVFNFTIYLYLLFFTFGLYKLLRYLKFDELTSFFTSLFTSTLPRIVVLTSFTGAIPSFAAFSLLPFSTLFLLKFLKDRNFHSGLIFSLLVSILFLLHHTTTVFFFCFVIFPIFLLYSKPFSKKFLEQLLILGVFFLLITSFWLVPFLQNLKYFNPGAGSQLDLKFFFNLIWFDSYGYEFLESPGIIFTLFSLLGIFLGLPFQDKKVKLNEEYKIILLIFSFTLFFLLLQQFNLHKTLPFFNKVRWERISFLFIFPLSLFLAFSISKFLKLKFKNFPILFILLLFLFFKNFLIFFTWNLNFLQEAAPIQDSPFNPLFDYLKSLEYGRIHSYGIYYPTFHPSVALKTEMPVISGWYHEGDYKYKFTVGKIEDLSQEAKFLEKISLKEFQSILNKTGTKYLIINLCSPEGFKVYSFLNNSIYPIQKFGNCITVYQTNYSSFSDPNLTYKRINSQTHLFKNLKAGNYFFKFTYFPYWKGYCDGKEVKIYKKEFWIGLNLNKPCKNFILKFEFPFYYLILKLISIFTLVFIILLISPLNKTKFLKKFLSLFSEAR